MLAMNFLNFAWHKQLNIPVCNIWKLYKCSAIFRIGKLVANMIHMHKVKAQNFVFTYTKEILTVIVEKKMTHA